MSPGAVVWLTDVFLIVWICVLWGKVCNGWLFRFSSQGKGGRSSSSTGCTTSLSSKSLKKQDMDISNYSVWTRCETAYEEVYEKTATLYSPEVWFCVCTYTYLCDLHTNLCLVTHLLMCLIFHHEAACLCLLTSAERQQGGNIGGLQASTTAYCFV